MQNLIQTTEILEPKFTTLTSSITQNTRNLLSVLSFPNMVSRCFPRNIIQFCTLRRIWIHCNHGTECLILNKLFHFEWLLVFSTPETMGRLARVRDYGIVFVDVMSIRLPNRSHNPLLVPLLSQFLRILLKLRGRCFLL